MNRLAAAVLAWLSSLLYAGGRPRGLAAALIRIIEWAQRLFIPRGVYCNNMTTRCPYWSIHSDKPEQENGYCAYLGSGDWGHNGFGLLWDAVKECDVKWAIAATNGGADTILGGKKDG